MATQMPWPEDASAMAVAVARRRDQQVKDRAHHLKLLKLEAFLRIKYPEALAEYNVWWEISRQLEEAVGGTK